MALVQLVLVTAQGLAFWLPAARELSLIADDPELAYTRHGGQR
jgi:hypothetical protein